MDDGGGGCRDLTRLCPGRICFSTNMFLLSDGPWSCGCGHPSRPNNRRVRLQCCKRVVFAYLTGDGGVDKPVNIVDQISPGV